MNDTFESRLEEVRSGIGAACARAGRDPGEVQLIAVAKGFGPESIREAAGAGLTVFGESRVQEARQKIPLSPSGLRWHMIGHLQTNKAREAVMLFDVIHSIDSVRVLQAVNAAAEAAGEVKKILLEVNVSGESAKFGLAPSDVPGVIEAANGLMNVNLAGFMTIPPFTPDPADVRPHFRALRELRDRWSGESGCLFPDISMGMSHDYGVAIEEGATMVRVGTALFGRRGGA
ncbi:MAG: YggS family pyridoxal phosphate-dependent enzyme [Lentisphaerae bacterium]|nr:YggS family pyridoxal phosphate-dependent enzyme [Lentisphaerota bacterium]